MIILDTDHFTVVRHADDPRHPDLISRLTTSEDRRIATTVITVEEQLRGWLAAIKRRHETRRQIPAYDRLIEVIEFLADWEVLPLDDSAVDEFERLRQQRIRIGTQDLKIAAIALSNNALLLSANLRDFRRVPRLKVENWI